MDAEAFARDVENDPALVLPPSTLVPLRGASARLSLEDRRQLAENTARGIASREGASHGDVLYSLDGGLTVTERPSLDGIPIETVIITAEPLVESFQRLADWKNLQGIPTTIRTVDWIYDAYPIAVDDAERIRFFLRDAYIYWGTRSVILAGGPELVPIRHGHSIAWNFPVGISIPTDYYYACLDGSWNANGNERFGEAPRIGYVNVSDQADFVPELEVGRIPCSNEEQAQQYLDDYFRYQLDPLPGYLDDVTLLGEVLYDADWGYGDCDDCYVCPSEIPCVQRDGAEDCFELMDALQASSSGEFFHFQELYERYYWWIPRGHPNALELTRRAFLQSLVRGTNVVFHAGHGNVDHWTLGPDVLDLSDFRVAAPGSPAAKSPGLVYSLSSSTADIVGDCIAEAFLFRPGAGAMVYIGSASLAFSNTEEVMRRFFLSRWPGDGSTDLGDAFYFSKSTTAEQLVSDRESSYRFVLMSLAFLGDPDARVWTSEPAAADVQFPESIELGTPEVHVSVALAGEPLGNARVSLYKGGDALAAGVTGADGTISLPFFPSSEGVARVTVTHPRVRPYRGELSVTGTAGAFVALVDAVVDDRDDVGEGIRGNGNGQIEVGETVAVDLVFENRGGGSAAEVLASLELSGVPEGVEIVLLDAVEDLGAVGAGESGEQARVFRFETRESNPGPAADRVLLPLEIRFDPDGVVPHGNDARLILQHEARRSRGLSTHYPFEPFAYRPELVMYETRFTEIHGNGDGVPSTGEVFELQFDLFNIGSGTASFLEATLRPADPSRIEVENPTRPLPDVEPHGHRVSEPYRFEILRPPPHELVFEVVEQLGSSSVVARGFDLWAPGSATGLSGSATSNQITLVWEVPPDPDVAGFRLYRAESDRAGQSGNFEVVGDGWIPRASVDAEHGLFVDRGLASRTAFEYQVVAVDSCGLTSAPGDVVRVSTPPPLLAGWPREVPSSRGAPTVADLDGDGIQEVVLSADVIYALRADGSPYDESGSDGRLTDPEDGYGFYPKAAIADLDRAPNGRKEIVTVSEYPSAHAEPRASNLTVFDDRGNVVWKQYLTDKIVFSSPAIGNIDGDADPEIVLLADRSVFALHADGTPVGVTPALLELPADVAGSMYGSVSLANVDDDPENEILFTTRSAANHLGYFYAINGDGTAVPRFPFAYSDVTDNFQESNASPAVADVSVAGGDGVSTEPTPEIFIATSSRVWMFDPDGGTGVLGWSRSIGVYPSIELNPSPAIADLDRDGSFEVVVGGARGRLYVLDALTGEPLPAFRDPGLDYRQIDPAPSGVGSPVVADLTGDGRPEIVIGDNLGNVHVYQHDGSVLPGFPFHIGGAVSEGLAVADLNGDGTANLLMQAKYRSAVFALDLGAGTYNASDPAARPWPQFRHDPRNLGFLERNAVGDIDPETLSPVGVEGDGPPLVFAVPPITPNPSLGRVSCAFDLPREAEVSVWIVSADGRRVRTLAEASFAPGRHRVPWDGKDERGRAAVSGVYFVKVRADGFGERTRKITILE